MEQQGLHQINNSRNRWMIISTIIESIQRMLSQIKHMNGQTEEMENRHNRILNMLSSLNNFLEVISHLQEEDTRNQHSPDATQ